MIVRIMKLDCGEGRPYRWGEEEAYGDSRLHPLSRGNRHRRRISTGWGCTRQSCTETPPLDSSVLSLQT